MKKKDNEKTIKTNNEKIANEETITENRTKLLNKLIKILDNIPYDKKLVNCKLKSCTCMKCKVGVNDIEDVIQEKICVKMECLKHVILLIIIVI